MNKESTFGDLVEVLTKNRLSLNVRHEGEIWIVTVKLLDGVKARAGVRCIEVSDVDLDSALVGAIERVERAENHLPRPIPPGVVRNGGVRCDMDVGPCVCGATHYEGEVR